MFEISELGKAYQQELIWEEAANQDGKPVVITIEINNDIRRKEARYSNQMGRIVFGVEPDQEKQEAAWVAEKLEYCLKIARLCVVDTNLFFDKGKPVKYKYEYLENALIQSQKLLSWFADAITEAFSEDGEKLNHTLETIDQD